MRMTEQEVMDYAAENDVKFIRLAFVDLYGTLKNMAITCLLYTSSHTR